MTRRHLLFQLAAAQQPPDLSVFFETTHADAPVRQAAFARLRQSWQPSYAAMLLELAGLLRQPSVAPRREQLVQFVAQLTKQNFGADMPGWQRWLWSLPYKPHPLYAAFKGHLYANIDPRMADFFPVSRPTPSRIRLDQVQWGGVPVNGIPPLINPATTPAADARYLKDQHIVFGIHANGEARAYPKRILAWHEMAIDKVGGLDLTIVYCTLCGTVIPYHSHSSPTRRHSFGTSGLLYESSKLMFDDETKSLWSTLQGQPVIGPLAESGLQLEFAPVATTTWGEWRAEFPHTRVLSLETGHTRDYGEGAAYRDYFASPELMFQVARTDSRLANKDEVLVVRLKGLRPLAIAVKHLRKQKSLSLQHDGVEILVRGENRVWADGKPVPAHRAFWFGWFTQFPDTVLIR